MIIDANKRYNDNNIIIIHVHVHVMNRIASIYMRSSSFLVFSSAKVNPSGS